MPKPLSEQLAELSVRAKHAEDALAATKKEAQNQLEARKEKAENSLMPEFFSYSEEMSGERESHIDSESAYVNTLSKKAVG